MLALPIKLRNELYNEFGFDKEFNDESSLLQSWTGRIFVCLPPPFKKGVVELLVNKALKREADLCVLLLPSDTSTEWFHVVFKEMQQDWVDRANAHYMAFNDPDNDRTNIRFIKGRIQWGNTRNKSRVPSLILILRK